MNDHFIPVGKPAPPRPRRFDFLTSSTSAAGCIVSAFRNACMPPRCWYTDSLWLSATPKFLVTIFSWVAMLGVGSFLRFRPGQRPDAVQGAAAAADRRLLLLFLEAPSQVVQDRVDLLRRQVQEVILAADHHRSVGARREALFLDERERAVGRGLARLDAQPLLDVVQDLVPAAQHAGDVRAH